MTTSSPVDREVAGAYIRLKEQLCGHLRARGVEPSAAADVVQDVFMKALATQRAGKSITNITGWLFAAARNAAIDHLRAARPTSPLGDDVAPDPPDDIQAHAALAECLRPMAARLPRLYAEAIEAVDLDQIALRDVARREGVSVSAIKSRASRGRRLLKAAVLRCCAVEVQGGFVMMAEPTEPDPAVAVERRRSRCQGAFCSGIIET